MQTRGGLKIKRENIYKTFKGLQICFMIIPFLGDYLVQGESYIGNLLRNINSNFLGLIFTSNILLTLSWISYGLLLAYVFRALKNLKIEGLKMLVLVIFNLFLQVEIKAVEDSYYFWIVSILSIFILEIVAGHYTPENKNVIDTTPEEER